MSSATIARKAQPTATIARKARPTATIARAEEANIWVRQLDEFTTDESAPLASPRTMEPGPGTLTLTQTDGEFSISSSELNFPAQSTATYGDQQAVGDSQSRIAGRAFLVSALTFDTADSDDEFTIGWWQSDTSLEPGQSAKIEHFFWFYRSAALYARSSTAGSSQGTYAASTAYDIAVVLRGTGAFFLRRVGSSGDYTLFWVDNVNTTATVYPAISNFTQAGTLDDFRVKDLRGAWESDYGIATNHVATTSADETTTMEANAIVEHTITAATDVTQELMVRRTDDNNTWIVRMDQTNSTIKLIEKNSGTETERSSASQTWTDSTDYRVVVICDGNDIDTYVDGTAKNSYASASFNSSATGVKVSHVGANLAAWPRAIALRSDV